MDVPPEGKKEEKQQMSEAPWESPWHEREEDIDSEKAVDVMMENCLKLERDVGEEELAIAWSRLEPRYENVWHIEGNTIRCIRLRPFYYAEHTELGLSEVGKDLEESLRRISKRSYIAVEYLLPMSEENQHKKMRELVASQGGQEAWRARFQDAIGSIIAGAMPTNTATILPELAAPEADKSRIGLFYPESAFIVVSEDAVELELPGYYEPLEVYLELEGEALYANRSTNGENRWIFTLRNGIGPQAFAFRPLVLAFKQAEGSMPHFHYSWPSVSRLELIESLAKAPGVEGKYK